MPDAFVHHRMAPPPAPALAGWLKAQSGARTVVVGPLNLLSGGAVQLNWGFEAEFDGGALPGRQLLVLRVGPPTPLPESRSKRVEFDALTAAHNAGVPVPEPLWLCDADIMAGAPFLIMRHCPGSAEAASVRVQAALSGDGDTLAAALGGALAKIHAVVPGGPVAVDTPRDRVAALRNWLLAFDDAAPALLVALDWLDAAAPEPSTPSFVHRDFRTGNFLVDQGELVAVLDWEFAGWGDPHEDIGWFCAACWRGDYPALAAGGLADRAPFYAAYAAQAGREIDNSRIRFWEIFAHLRWAIIALQQGRRAQAGDSPRHELIEAEGRVPGLTRDIARMIGQ